MPRITGEKTRPLLYNAPTHAEQLLSFGRELGTVDHYGKIELVEQRHVPQDRLKRRIIHSEESEGLVVDQRTTCMKEESSSV